MTPPNFHFRDLRRQHIQDVLGKLDAQLEKVNALLADSPFPEDDEALVLLRDAIIGTRAGLLSDIKPEQEVLDSRDWRVTDRTYRFVAEDWLFQATAEDIQAQVGSDPTLIQTEFLARRDGEGEQIGPLLTPEHAQAIAELPRTPGGPSPDFLDQVRAAVNNNDAVLTEVVHAAHRRWLSINPAERVYPYDEVGILLPLRLETLFKPSAAGETLFLRVIPDEVSICRDNPNVTPTELEFLQAFWNTTYTARDIPNGNVMDWFNTDAAHMAWIALCQSVGNERAAWLVTEFLPTVQGDAPVLNVPLGDAQPNRVGGLPPLLQVWGVTTNDSQLIGTLEPKSELLTLPLPKTSAEMTQGWWADWTQAKLVGLGGEFELPDGMTHDTLTALFVAGIGDETPDAHFRAQVDAGELGILRLGEPTNSVQGAQAAFLARDAETWFGVVRHRLQLKFMPSVTLQNMAADAFALNTALTGDGNGLPLVPVGDGNKMADSEDRRDANESRRFVHALGPALWGHYLRDIWRRLDDAHRLIAWANNNLYPEGPLPPIRIDDQPYGLVPTTAFAAWRSRTGDETAQLEEKMLGGLTELRAAWAQVAEKRGTTTDADTNKLMELLRNDALTAKYVYRYFLPTKFFADIYRSLINPDEFKKAARELYQKTREILGIPDDTDEDDSSISDPSMQRYYLATGSPSYLNIPLITAQRIRWQPGTDRVITTALMRLEGGNSANNFFGEDLTGVLPDSLLIRLLLYSTMLAEAWYAQEDNGPPVRLLNEFSWDSNEIGESIIDIMRRGFGAGHSSPLAMQTHDTQIKAAFDLAKELDGMVRPTGAPASGFTGGKMEASPERLAQLERAFRATLDTAAYRIDPWLTGIAWRRFQENTLGQRNRARLGAYGWVDGPFIGKSGPTDAGRLHAPSQAQALTGVILRDKYLSSKRAFAHAAPPAAGRDLWDMNLNSEVVRGAVELAEEVQTGFHLYEVLGRKVEEIIATRQGVALLRQKFPMHDPHPHAVCNGQDALNGLLKGDPAFPLSNDQQAALGLLQRTLDAYGDLLVADAVHQVVTGHADTAAQVMDAAAGLDRPPIFETVQTPPSGYILQTSALTALPAANIAGVETRPCVIAEPSIDAYIATQFPDTRNYQWHAVGKQIAVQPDGTPTETSVQFQVSLFDLGLDMFEAAQLGADVMETIVCALGGIDRLESLDVPRPYRTARQMIGAFGTQPATARALAQVNAKSEDEWAQIDSKIHDDLLHRWNKLKDKCSEIIGKLNPDAAVSDQVAALRGAVLWNVVPTSDPRAQRALYLALFKNIQPDPALLKDLVKNAAEVLQKRLRARDEPIPSTIAEFARAISTLATGDSKLCILARMPKDVFLAQTKLTVSAPHADLDQTWLTMVAAVRPPLARLESLQLQASQLNTHHGFTAWSNSSTDPWQSNLVTAQESRLHNGTLTTPATPRFVAAYGPANTWDGTAVAVGLVDQFGESIPLPERSTYMAFGFNAPASRAPQAILLAVPPTPRQRLDEDVLLSILRETRELAHARAVQPHDLGEFLSLVPTLWFDGAGLDRVRLDSSTNFSA